MVQAHGHGCAQGTACYKMRPPGAMSGHDGMDVQLRQWPPCDRPLAPLSAGDYVIAAITGSTPGTYLAAPVLRTDHARWTAWSDDHLRLAGQSTRGHHSNTHGLCHGKTLASHVNIQTG